MLNLYFLNVQHGDSVVLEYQTSGHRYFGVIDSNVTGNSTPPALKKLQELGAEELSFVCITHPHADHYKGMHAILSHYKSRIQHFYTFPVGDILADTEQLKKYVKQYTKLLDKQDDPEITQRSLELVQILISAYEQFSPHGTWFEQPGSNSPIYPPGFEDGIDIRMIMPPPKARGARYITQIRNDNLGDPENLEANELSLALLLSYGGKTVMLGGDACSENWSYDRRIYQKHRSPAGHVVKLPHHGSKRDCNSDTLPMWFHENGERIGIISAKGGTHPDAEVLDWLLENKVRIFCTNLSKRWAKSNVVDFVNTSGLEGSLGRYIRQNAIDRAKKIQPCQGDIQVSIQEDGDINIQTEFSNMCGCKVQEIENLLADAS